MKLGQNFQIRNFFFVVKYDIILKFNVNVQNYLNFQLCMI